MAVLVLALSAALLPAPAPFGHAADGGEPLPARQERKAAAADAQFVPGELIVKWAPGASAQARARARKRQGLRKVRDLPLIGAEVARIRSGHAPPAAAARARAEARVAYAEPNYLVRAQQVPDDPLFDRLWGLRNTGQEILGTPGQAGVDVDALTAWEQTRGDGVVVAVIDTGIDIGHPDLADRIWQNPDPGADPRYPGDVHGWDFHDDDATVFDLEDGDSHGTHVAGTIAASAGNGVGVAGVAPEVQIMPLKFLGPAGGATSDAIRALEYASDRGVRIANASWGASFSQALEDAIAASGMVVVAAAGNSAEDNDGAGALYPCSYDLAAVLCVAAVTHTGGLAGFSNFGQATVDVGAPGQAILSTVPPAPASTVALEIDDPDGGYRAMLWGFSFWDVVGADDRRDLLAGAVGAHLGVAPDGAILLVDDDESARPEHPDARDVYAQALAAAGFTDVAVHEVAPDAGGPTAAAMAAHDAVVWFTGMAFGDGEDVTTLTAGDQAALVAYLDGGGRLLLAGQDALWRIEDSPLVTGTLHADVVTEVEGRPDGEGDPGSVYAGQAYDLSGAESPFTTPSVFLKHVEPRSGAAIPALSFPRKPYDEAYAYFSGTSMAAPHAAGVAALLADVAPDLPSAGVVAHLRDTVTPLAALTGTTVAGGMVDAAAAIAVEDLPAPPSRPRSVAATPGDAQAGVSWLPPASDGGMAITGYTVTADPGGHTADVDAGTLAATVAGLTNGTAYTFTVTAHNPAGTSPPSAPSAAVTPAAPPAAPRSVTATAGDAQADVSWLAPTSDGGAAITGYTVTAAPGGHTADVAAGTLVATVAGLDNGIAYRFTVTAHNAAGTSPPSAPSVAVVPTPATACADRAVPDPGFTDIAGNTHEAAIACVVWHGVAQGTSATTYAPRSTVTRAQMASFVARTIEAAGAHLPAGEGQFTDVAGNTHEDNIERLAAADIVQGVGGGRYAPRATVTRAQMASFLARAFAFVDGVPLPVASTAFTDIAGNTHADNIARVAGAGFAQGTTATTYSPGAGVRRDQMAAFLSRMLERFAADGRITEPGS